MYIHMWDEEYETDEYQEEEEGEQEKRGSGEDEDEEQRGQEIKANTREKLMKIWMEFDQNDEDMKARGGCKEQYG